MADFAPIDHKDSDAEYRELVRQTTEQIVGAKLLEIVNAEEFHGQWQVTHPPLNIEPHICEFFPNGTHAHQFSDAEKPSDKWSFDSGVLVEETWFDPMPDYGIEEGGFEENKYHGAKTEDGCIAIWNGDGSILRLLKPLAR